MGGCRVVLFVLKVARPSPGGFTNTCPGEPDGGPQPSHGRSGGPGGPGVLVPA